MTGLRTTLEGGPLTFLGRSEYIGAIHLMGIRDRKSVV